MTCFSFIGISEFRADFLPDFDFFHWLNLMPTSFCFNKYNQNSSDGGGNPIWSQAMCKKLPQPAATPSQLNQKMLCAKTKVLFSPNLPVRIWASKHPHKVRKEESWRCQRSHIYSGGDKCWLWTCPNHEADRIFLTMKNMWTIIVFPLIIGRKIRTKCILKIHKYKSCYSIFHMLWLYYVTFT